MQEGTLRSWNEIAHGNGTGQDETVCQCCFGA
jgi:hypothetical protein